METAKMAKIDEIADPLLELNLAVAAIAGWENIEEWNPNPKTEKPKRTFTGTNKKHPELGIFVPNYAESLDAITKAFNLLGLNWNIGKDCDAYSFIDNKLNVNAFGETPAIALCKLLLKLAAAETQPELEPCDFVTIAGLEIET
jgi:hypothetical protein